MKYNITIIFGQVQSKILLCPYVRLIGTCYSSHEERTHFSEHLAKIRNLPENNGAGQESGGSCGLAKALSY